VKEKVRKILFWHFIFVIQINLVGCA